MGVGAVPIVYPIGGQKEIVTDGVNGFTFTSQEELLDKTLQLIRNDAKRREVARKGVEDSSMYSVETFTRKIRELLL